MKSYLQSLSLQEVQAGDEVIVIQHVAGRERWSKEVTKKATPVLLTVGNKTYRRSDGWERGGGTPHPDFRQRIRPANDFWLTCFSEWQESEAHRDKLLYLDAFAWLKLSGEQMNEAIALLKSFEEDE